MKKKRLKHFFKSVTGLTVYRKLPFGLDVFDDLKYKMRDYNFDIFVYVGANIGQSAINIHNRFPDSKIYCIEPFRETFKSLKINTAKIGAFCYPIALGAKTEKLEEKLMLKIRIQI